MPDKRAAAVLVQLKPKVSVSERGGFEIFLTPET